MYARRRLCLLLVALTASVGCDDDDDTKSSDSAYQGEAGASPRAGSSGRAGAGPAAGKGGSAAAGKGAAGKSGAGGTSAGSRDAGADDDAGTTGTTGEVDYADAKNWLCRPDHSGACDVNLDASIVKADGSVEEEKFKADAKAPIDCFYVYPTVSLDTTPNSDLVAGPEEQNVVRAQFARFASQCRLFAPLYRQVTLTSLRASLSGGASTADRTLGYRDVLGAWKYYLEHYNQGRGVVLVGHSQGSSVLTQLIREQLDKEQLDERFISALLIGTNVTVPKDKPVGGSFKHVPLCTKADQLGCVVVYASFRSDVPPPANSLFATSTDPNLVAACTNPAALGGGSAELHAYLSNEGPGQSSGPMGPWVEGKTIDTPFVSVPGLLTAECKSATSGAYLSIEVKGDPSDPRADNIAGDVVTNGEVQANWGLHLIDVHLAMGNLLDVVKAQSEAFRAR